MNFTALKSSLASVDPALSDAQVNALPGYGVPAYRDVSVAEISALIDTMEPSPRVPLTLASLQSDDATLQSAAIQALGLINANYATVHMTSPVIAAKVVGAAQLLTVKGIFTPQQAGQILALTQYYAFGSATTEADIAAARASIASDAAAAQLAADRQTAADALRDRINGIVGRFMNERLNPAMAAGDALPAWSDFAAMVAGEVG